MEDDGGWRGGGRGYTDSAAWSSSDHFTPSPRAFLFSLSLHGLADPNAAIKCGVVCALTRTPAPLCPPALRVLSPLSPQPAPFLDHTPTPTLSTRLAPVTLDSPALEIASL